MIREHRTKRATKKVWRHSDYWARFVWHKTHPDGERNAFRDVVSDAHRGGAFVPSSIFEQTQARQLNGSPYTDGVRASTLQLEDEDLWESVARLYSWSFLIQWFSLPGEGGRLLDAHEIHEMVEASEELLGWECERRQEMLDRSQLLRSDSAAEFHMFVNERCVELLGGEPEVDVNGVPQLLFISMVSKRHGWELAFEAEELGESS